MTIEIPGPVYGKIEEVEPAAADKPALLVLTIEDDMDPEKRAEIQRFTAWFRENFAGAVITCPALADPEASR